MTLNIETLTGARLAAALPDVARLRITVFRDWPYLYDGDLAYEERYLQSYRDSPRAILVGAFDGEKLVGASTGTPLADHAEDFAAAFAETGMDISTLFYCAESVLLPGYRGLGAGHAFFDQREAHARALGFAGITFCTVVRSADHPQAPSAPRALEPFWRGRGYAPLPGVIAQFNWRDVGDAGETAKDLQFWHRAL